MGTTKTPVSAAPVRDQSNIVSKANEVYECQETVNLELIGSLRFLAHSLRQQSVQGM